MIPKGARAISNILLACHSREGRGPLGCQLCQMCTRWWPAGPWRGAPAERKRRGGRVIAHPHKTRPRSPAGSGTYRSAPPTAPQQTGQVMQNPAQSHTNVILCHASKLRSICSKVNEASPRLTVQEHLETNRINRSRHHIVVMIRSCTPCGRCCHFHYYSLQGEQWPGARASVSPGQ